MFHFNVAIDKHNIPGKLQNFFELHSSLNDSLTKEKAVSIDSLLKLMSYRFSF